MPRRALAASPLEQSPPLTALQNARMNSSMSNQGAKLTETFRQSRSDAARGPAGKKAVAAPAGPAAVAALNPQQQQQQQQEEADEAALRQFDLDSR